MPQIDINDELGYGLEGSIINLTSPVGSWQRCHACTQKGERKNICTAILMIPNHLTNEYLYGAVELYIHSNSLNEKIKPVSMEDSSSVQVNVGG